VKRVINIWIQNKIFPDEVLQNIARLVREKMEGTTPTKENRMKYFTYSNFTFIFKKISFFN
jgi:hypothetical protein